jgi:hypothetical protein
MNLIREEVPGDAQRAKVYKTRGSRYTRQFYLKQAKTGKVFGVEK